MVSGWRYAREIETRVEAGEPVVTVTDEVLNRPIPEKEFPSTEKFDLVEESEEGLEFELEMVGWYGWDSRWEVHNCPPP